MKKWLVFILIAIVVVVGGFFALKNTGKDMAPSKNPANNSDVDKVISTKTPATKSVKIGVLGKSDLTSYEKITVVKLKWFNAVPNDVDYILVDNSLDLTKKEKDYLNYLVENQNVVAFYGNDVSQKDVRENLGVKFDDVDLKATVDLVFPLFGYGYSKTEKKDMPIFLGVNKSMVTDMDKRNSFIYDFLEKYDF
jgi:hypothetical protein